MDHSERVHENNPILNVLSIAVLIGLVMFVAWGTTYTAQAITGKRLIQQGRGFVPVAASHTNHTDNAAYNVRK